MDQRSIIDISRVLDENTAVWPGDTPFSRKWVMAIPDGCSCNTSTITLSAHTGAHTDAPSHFVEGAPNIDQVSLTKYMGRCRVVHTKNRDCVILEDIAGVDLTRCQRVLFRTPQAPATDAWDNSFTYISREVAEALVKARIRLVGIDTPSVDSMNSKTLDAHKILFEGGVAILESIDLSDVFEGYYQLIALPLRIKGGDSSPVRAVLLPLDS
jgi:arylformamidase